jgi:ABC-type bacteriocin/lantibiotic exporter with double-glycine peptidase domain
MAQHKKASSNPMSKFWDLLLSERKEISSVYFYAILSGLVQLTVPVGVQAIIGFSLGASMVTSIYVLIIVVVLGVFAVGVMQINQMRIIEKIQQRIFTRYAFVFADVIPKIDLREADSSYMPEKVNRFFDIVNLQKGLSKLLLDIPTAAIQIVFGLLLLTFYHPVFVIFGLLLIIILVLVFRLTGKIGLQTSLKESSYKYSLVAWLEEVARAIIPFKYHSGEELNLIKTDERVTGYLQSRTAHFKVLLVQYKTLLAFKVLVTLVMLSAGTYLLLEQQINIGEFIAAEIVILNVIGASEKLIGNIDSVYDVITGLEKISMVTESELEKRGTVPFSNEKKEGVNVELHNVSFEYPDGKKVLSNVNVSIPHNSLVTISGADGSGKTTLLKIISGIYPGSTGEILINGIPVENYNTDALRQNMGVYLGKQGLFAGSVWENISLGREEITFDAIMDIAERSGLKSFLRALPNGFDTKIDPAGKRLPSSIAQKILLLRAFANGSKLLLLEEPWPEEDMHTKRAVLNYLTTVKSHTTILIVTSDDEAIQRSDIHFLVENGTLRSSK